MSDGFQFWSQKTSRIFVRKFRQKIQARKYDAERFKLLIITQFFPPDYAATGQLIQELAHQLSDKNIQVSIFTGQPGYAYVQKQAPTVEISHNVRIQRSRFKQFYAQRIRSKTLNSILFTIASGWYLLKNARHYNAVILTTAPPFLSLIGYLANIILNLDYICLVYDLYPDVVVELGVVAQQNLIIKLWHKINHAIWRRSKKIVVLSDTMKQRIITQYPAIADKISVIHNWADPSWIMPIPKTVNWFAEKYQINDKFTVLYSGNLGHCHDLETILDTAKLLQKQPIQFIFIGGGAKYQKCQQAVTKLNLSNCLFLPYQDRANLPYSLTACDLALVSIARGLEGVVAPSKVYGVMAAGKAIAAICEPHSYLRQIIINAHCGAAFNHDYSEQLAKFILTLAADPDLTNSLGDAGRNYLQQHFTPELIAQQYYDILGVEERSASRNRDRQHILYGMANS